MNYVKCGKFIVEQIEFKINSVLKVWEPLQKGRFYKEVSRINGKLYGRIGTKYPYIKKIKTLTREEYINYKQEYDKIGFEKAYSIIHNHFPEIMHETYMKNDGKIFIMYHM